MDFNNREFRDALGRFATGVCIVAANPEGREPFGLTVNSFAAVSLEPPLILWSLQKDSELFEALSAAERFSVNFLRAGQEALSARYASKGSHRLSPEDFEIGATGVPVLPQSLASLECDSEARYPGGDHVIFVGRVRALQHRGGGQGGREDQPLLFYAGAYTSLDGGSPSDEPSATLPAKQQ